MITIVKNQVILFGLKDCKYAVHNVVNDLNIPEDSIDAYDICLILVEAIANAFKHGNKGDSNKPIQINYMQNDNDIIFEIIDTGTGFDYNACARKVSEHNLMIEGGRGIHLIQSLADCLSNEGNKFIIKRKLQNQ